MILSTLNFHHPKNFLQVFGLFGLIWFVLMLARFDIISLDPFENIANNSTKTNEQLTPLETPSHFAAHGKQGYCYFKFCNINMRN